MRRVPLFTIFKTFFKIGLFTFGGGFAMIPLIEREIVENYGWIEKDKFLDAISLTQSVPGAVAINLAIFFGYDLAGFVGALAAMVGVALPSFIIILMIAFGFNKFSQYQLVKQAFQGIRPAVVGLIIYAGLNLTKNINWSYFLLAVLGFVVIGSAYFHLNPVLIIILAVITGFGSYGWGMIDARQKAERSEP